MSIYSRVRHDVSWSAYVDPIYFLYFYPLLPLAHAKTYKEFRLRFGLETEKQKWEASPNKPKKQYYLLKKRMHGTWHLNILFVFQSIDYLILVIIHNSYIWIFCLNNKENVEIKCLGAIENNFFGISNFEREVRVKNNIKNRSESYWVWNRISLRYYHLTSRFHNDRITCPINWKYKVLRNALTSYATLLCV